MFWNLDLRFEGKRRFGKVWELGIFDLDFRTERGNINVFNVGIV